MPSTLLTIFTPQTQQQRLDGMYALASTLGVDIVGVQAERMFSVLYEIEAQAKAKEDNLRVQVAMGGFLDTVVQAGSAWVDLIAGGWFNLFRASATQTVGIASLTCGALAVGGNVGAQQQRFLSSSGVMFDNAEPFTVVPNATVPVVLEAVPDFAGTAGNVPVGLTWQNLPTLTNCTLTNPGMAGSWITAAGVNAEADDSLVKRCLARWAATSYGGAASAYREWINAAFAYVGLTNPINRVGVDDTNPNGPGSTDIYLADTAGPATVAELATVNSYLQPRRSLGTGPLRVLPAPALSVPIVASVYGNTNAVALAAALLQGLEANVDLGGTIFWAELNALLMGIPGVRNVTLSSPAPVNDITLSGYQVPTFAPTISAFA